jgi:hypothetical protein
MTSLVRTTAAGFLAALALGTAVVSAPAPAAAHDRGFGLAAGIIGGIAAGALIAGATRSHGEVYYDAPRPIYEAEPAYAPAPLYAPAPAYGYQAVEPSYVEYAPQCWHKRVPQFGPGHEFYGWRDRRVCR